MNGNARIAALLSIAILTLILFAGQAQASERPEGQSPEVELKMFINSMAPKEAKGAIRLRITIENSGAQDVILNLGTMLANGNVHLPQAIRLILTDSTGKARELHFSDRRYPGVAGRVDDYIVPLRVGSAYTVALNLDDYWCPATKEYDLKLAAGEYRIHAELTGQGAQHVNGDTEGIRLLHFWQGKLASDSVKLLFSVPSFTYSQESPLKLTMKADKEKYKVGEEITLQCKVQNISDKVVAFHPYNQKTVEIRNDKNELCIKDLGQTMENSEPLVTLQPNGTLEYALKGGIVKRKGAISSGYKEGIQRKHPKGGNYKEVFGIFVEFPWDSYYLQENYIKYKITSYFQDGNMLEIDSLMQTPEKRKELLKDKWQGKLTSNTIIVEITK